MQSARSLCLVAVVAVAGSLGAAPALAQPPPEAPAAPTPPPAPPGAEEEFPAGPYARRGIRELGGAGHLSGSKDSTTAGLTPFIGWFLADGFELSFMVNLTYTRASSFKPRDLFVGYTNESKATAFGYALIEPSYHLRASARLFPFVGVGLGGAYTKPAGVDGKGGFAVAPRLGLNVVVGRTGVFTPAVNLVYTSADTIRVSESETLKINTTYGISGAFSVFF